MQYTGDRFDADTALKWGMVSKVVPHEQLMEATLELATRLAEGPVYTMGMVKYLILQSGSQGFEESLRQARAANAIARTTFDHKEGVQAFIEKRTPRFEGR
jgi:enoyl-CoA hydratase/carnithine racemase